MSKTALLVRVSSKEQEENYSLDAQEEKLREYCKQKGFQRNYCI